MTRGLFYYELETTSGKKLRFSTQLSPWIGEALERHVLKTQVDDAEQRLNQGEELAFGVARISQQGLRVRGRALKWDQISSLMVDERMVMLRARQQSWHGSNAARLRIREVPNLPLLLKLSERYVNVERRWC